MKNMVNINMIQQILRRFRVFLVFMCALTLVVAFVDSRDALAQSETAMQKAPPLLQPKSSSGIMVHEVNQGGGISTGFPSYRIPRDATLQNFRILVILNVSPGPVVVTMFVNGNPTSISATIPAGSTADVDISGSVSVADGDSIMIKSDKTAPPSGGQIRYFFSYEVL